MSTKMLKILGVGISILTLGLSLLADWKDEQQLKILVDEVVTTKLSEIK